MKYEELVKKIESAGWAFKRNGKGSHRVFERNGQTLPIPCHGAHDIPVGTAKKILKLAGVK
jgi:mRNA interferase HicA